MSNNAARCKNCGKPVPARYSALGIPQGSLWLIHADKNKRFCTMRCAAEYGIAKAEGVDAPELLGALRDCVRAINDEVRAAQDDGDESPSPMIEGHARVADRGAAMLIKYGVRV